LGGGVFSGQEPPVNTATVGACEKSAGRWTERGGTDSVPLCGWNMDEKENSLLTKISFDLHDPDINYKLETNLLIQENAVPIVLHFEFERENGPTSRLTVQDNRLDNLKRAVDDRLLQLLSPLATETYETSVCPSICM
jgi:hypothetical protein